MYSRLNQSSPPFPIIPQQVQSDGVASSAPRRFGWAKKLSLLLGMMVMLTTVALF